MTPRKRLSPKALLALFKTHKGLCHLCGGKIGVGEKWERSHPIPLELGGKDDASNWALAHVKCHAAQTAKIDIPAISRAKRQEAAHLGIRKSGPPIKSAGFEKKPKREPRPALPPRQLYTRRG